MARPRQAARRNRRKAAGYGSVLLALAMFLSSSTNLRRSVTLLQPQRRSEASVGGDRQVTKERRNTATIVTIQRQRVGATDTATATGILRSESHDGAAKNNIIAAALTNDDNGGVDDEFVTKVWEVTPRVFRQWPRNVSLPCYHPTADSQKADNTAGSIATPATAATATDTVHWTDPRQVQRTPSRHGFLFVKLLKSAGSTGAGINIRIARNVARRQQQQQNRTEQQRNFEVCNLRYLHGRAGPGRYHYRKRVKQGSYLWTLLRNPVDRYLSEFFHFEHSRLGRPVTDANVINFLRRGPHSDHHSLQWLAVAGYRHGQFNPYRTAQRIITQYDFVGISERMEETLVALMMLLNLPMSDILHVSVKNSGGYDDGGYQDTCYKIVKPEVLSEGLQSFLRNDATWKRYIAPEVALYQAANRSLDLTIQQLQQSTGLFEANLRLFRRAQGLVHDRCTTTTSMASVDNSRNSTATVRLPCTQEGVLLPQNETDCVWSDLGCGFDCIDQVATELSLW